VINANGSDNGLEDQAPRRLGDMVRLIRKEKNRTLDNVAALCGLSVSYLSDIELNRTVPSLDALSKIAAALDHVLKIELSEPGDTTIPVKPIEIELLIAVRNRDFARFMLIAGMLMGNKGAEEVTK